MAPLKSCISAGQQIINWCNWNNCEFTQASKDTPMRFNYLCTMECKNDVRGNEWKCLHETFGWVWALASTREASDQKVTSLERRSLFTNVAASHAQLWLSINALLAAVLVQGCCKSWHASEKYHLIIKNKLYLRFKKRLVCHNVEIKWFYWEMFLLPPCCSVT